MHANDYQLVCERIDAKIAAAEKRVLSAVAEALRALGENARTQGKAFYLAASEQADLLSPKPEKVEVPTVDWAEAADESSWNCVARVRAFARFMRDNPGAKVVVE